jgi:hypothetical protein
MCGRAYVLGGKGLRVCVSAYASVCAAHVRGYLSDYIRVAAYPVGPGIAAGGDKEAGTHTTGTAGGSPEEHCQFRFEGATSPPGQSPHPEGR